METIGTWWMWAGFFAIVLVMLAIDLFKIPVLFSLGAVAAIIATSIALSLRNEARQQRAAPRPDADQR